MKIFQITLFTILFCFTTSCQQQKVDHRPTISVSIAPLAFLTEQIVDSDFVINTMVPSGANVETYEPTPTQMRQVAQSQFYISTGLLDFEQQLNNSIQHNMPNVRNINVSKGISLITGHAHLHSEKHHHSISESNAVDTAHEQFRESSMTAQTSITGIDPHIWNSPQSAKIIAKNIYDGLAALYPDSVRYKTNYEKLISRLDSLDYALNEMFQTGNTAFIIYHPALTYLARDYNLRQISLEKEGKEPSAEYLKQLIDTVKKLNINQIFYQQQFSRSSVEALSNELDIPAIPFDPLAPNLIQNTLNICTQIAHP